jgi:addiction module RelE/StbE family toxin
VASRKPETTFVAAEAIGAQFKALKAEFPEIQGTIETFNLAKRAVPPEQLPRKMKDHVLQGPLDGIRECHLAPDVLLLYVHEENTVYMLHICRHNDLYGRRGQQIGAHVRSVHSHLKATPARKKK